MNKHSQLVSGRKHLIFGTLSLLLLLTMVSTANLVRASIPGLEGTAIRNQRVVSSASSNVESAAQENRVAAARNGSSQSSVPSTCGEEGLVKTGTTSGQISYCPDVDTTITEITDMFTCAGGGCPGNAIEDTTSTIEFTCVQGCGGNVSFVISGAQRSSPLNIPVTAGNQVVFNYTASNIPSCPPGNQGGANVKNFVELSFSNGESRETCGPSFRATGQGTPSATSTSIATAAPSATNTATATATNTATATATNTATATPSATNTATATATATATPSATNTATGTSTTTATNTRTATAVTTATGTSTSLPTRTSTPGATTTRTPTAGCQFAILSYRACLDANGCVSYSIPVQNTDESSVVVQGSVEIQGRGNRVLGTAIIPPTLIEGRGITNIMAEVCITEPNPEGPFQLVVTIRDIGRACDEKTKSQPLRECNLTATPQATSTVQRTNTAQPTSTVQATSTRTVTGTAISTATTVSTSTATSIATNTRTATAVSTSTGTPMTTRTATVVASSTATPTAITTITISATNTQVPATNTATAVPSTNTVVPATNIPISPTSTPVPATSTQAPSNTAVPPTNTQVVQSTAIPGNTSTPVMPTETKVPATNTVVPATSTVAAAPATSTPAGADSTPALPANVPVTLTETPTEVVSVAPTTAVIEAPPLSTSTPVVETLPEVSFPPDATANEPPTSMVLPATGAGGSNLAALAVMVAISTSLALAGLAIRRRANVATPLPAHDPRNHADEQ